MQDSMIPDMYPSDVQFIQIFYSEFLVFIKNEIYEPTKLSLYFTVLIL